MYKVEVTACRFLEILPSSTARTHKRLASLLMISGRLSSTLPKTRCVQSSRILTSRHTADQHYLAAAGLVYR